MADFTKLESSLNSIFEKLTDPEQVKLGAVAINELKSVKDSAKAEESASLKQIESLLKQYKEAVLNSQLPVEVSGQDITPARPQTPESALADVWASAESEQSKGGH